MTVVTKAFASGTVVISSIIFTVVNAGKLSSVIALVYGFFFTAISGVDSWLLRVLFILVVVLSVIFIYKISESYLAVNIAFVVYLLLSIPFFSIQGL